MNCNTCGKDLTDYPIKQLRIFRLPPHPPTYWCPECADKDHIDDYVEQERSRGSLNEGRVYTT